MKVFTCKPGPQEEPAARPFKVFLSCKASLGSAWGTGGPVQTTYLHNKPKVGVKGLLLCC